MREGGKIKPTQIYLTFILDRLEIKKKKKISKWGRVNDVVPRANLHRNVRLILWHKISHTRDMNLRKIREISEKEKRYQCRKK